MRIWLALLGFGRYAAPATVKERLDEASWDVLADWLTN